MATEFDQQRKEVRETIDRERQDAASAYGDFLNLATEQVKSAWSSGVRKFVEETESPKTQELGAPVVKALKADLVRLDKDARNVVQAELDKLQAWTTYRQEDPPSSGQDRSNGEYLDFRDFHTHLPYQTKPRLPDSLRQALESATAKADELLRKHGWGSSARSYNYGRARLIHLPDPTAAMIDTVRRYSVSADNIAKGRARLAEIDLAESRHTAKSLWDET